MTNEDWVDGNASFSDSKLFNITNISGNTSEDGTNSTFKVKLKTAPLATVTASVSSSNNSEGTVSSSSLTFTQNNWETNQTVTVTGVNDSDSDGHQHYQISLSADVVELAQQTPNWVYCANEGGTCSFSGTKTVRYGLNGYYNTKDATGSIGCNNSVFGDPLYGYGKQCHYDSNSSSVAGTTWTAQSSGTSKDFRGVTYGNNKYVAVGKDGKIFTSTSLSLIHI